ncbi:unnamed protein product [Cunninghamella blakesleeana]
MQLSPTQLYYLKKELIKLEVEREWKYLQTSCVDLSNLLSIPIERSSFFTTSDLPFIRFIFQQFIKPFPLLKNQPIEQQDLFWNQCQLFLQEWYKHQPFTWMPPTTHEYQERRAMVSKLKKMMIAFLNLLIESDKKEESIPLIINDALQEPQGNDNLNTDSLTSLTKNTEKRMNIVHHSNLYKVSIISAQPLNISTQKQFSYHFNILSSPSTSTPIHLYFIIELTNINHGTVHYVARRHKEFRLLAKKLRSQFPERNDIPLVPNKIRKKETDNENNSDELLGEIDRRRLKNFLHQLLLIPQICQCQLFIDFLLLSSSSLSSSARIQYDQLNEEDINKRKLLDDQYLKEQEKHQKYIDDTLNSLENDLLLLKQQLMKPGGCIKILNVIKATPDWNGLPEHIKKCFDWGSLCFAFTLHKQLVVSDLAIENRNQLKKTHAFLPYRTLSTLLRFSNPIKMVKGMLDLFLARPFGGSSLMQRVISLNLQEEIDSIQKDIKELEDKIDPMICNKLKQAVLTERKFEEHDDLEGLSSKDALLFILKHSDIQPILTANQLQSIKMEEGADIQKTNGAIFWKDVQRIWYLYGKRQDQEQWMDLLLQGSTGILLQSIVSILYSPLAEIYQAADLAKTLYDLKEFMEDLISVVQQIEQKQQENEELFLVSSKENTQLFIDLIYRHQSSFYQFVHKVHTQSKSTLFTDLIEFADHWLKQIQKQGLSSPSSSSLKRKWKIDEFWDKVALNQHDEVELMKDIDILCNYHRSRKLYTLEKRQYKMKIMMTQQNENEWSNYWSDDDDDDDDENDDDDDNDYKKRISHLINNRAPIPPLIPTPSLVLSKLLPTFINQIIPVLICD